MSQKPASQAQQAPNGGSEAWDEARIEEAMQQLKILHIKVTFLGRAFKTKNC